LSLSSFLSSSLVRHPALHSFPTRRSSDLSTCALGITFPRIAVSGHSVTQSMHPTQLPAMNSGISGAMNEKSRGAPVPAGTTERRSEEHTSELQSHLNLVCRLLLEKKKHKR